MRRLERRRSRASSLIEIAITVSVATILATRLLEGLASGGQPAGHESTTQSRQQASQYNLNLLARDIESADRCLASYTNGSTTYRSDAATTLVLRTPSLNSAGTATTATEDYIVYQVVATEPGSVNGPYTLNRRVFPANGSGRNWVSNQIIAYNLRSAAFFYITAPLTGSTVGSAKISPLGAEEPANLANAISVSLPLSVSVGDPNRVSTVSPGIILRVTGVLRSKVVF